MSSATSETRVMTDGAVLAVDIRQLSYEYPSGVRALNRVDLAVEKGQCVAIMGPNGAGKSTLCLTLNGVIPHSVGGAFYGAVHIAGLDTMTHQVHDLARRVGLVMQNPEAQLLCPSVEDELAFGPENLCVPVSEIRDRIHAIAAAVRIADLLDRGPADLSGGQIQRVITAAMLTMDPEIMVFDEATSALDPRGALALFELARELNRTRAMTVLMTEHKSEPVAEFADRVVILNNGEVIDVGTPRQVFSQVERLTALGIAPPQVTRLMHALGFSAEALPVTLDAAEAMIRPKLAAAPAAPSEEDPPRGDGHDTSATRGALAAPVIEARDVSFRYAGKIDALRGVTLTIRQGEFVGLIGENGAGKTTLVKHFVGLLKPTDGTLTVLGRPAGTLTTSSLAGRIGLVLQNPDHQLFKTSVADEVKVGPARLRLKGDALETRAREAMQAVGIFQMADRHPLSLSWGDRQRVALASILAMQPEVVIFDEPTTGQDLAGRTIFMDLAYALNARGYTIIVITHDMELITRYARRCVVMKRGRVVMDDTTKEVFRHVDLLGDTFIEVPQIVQLAHRLSDCGVPPNTLTVEEMTGVLKRMGVGA
ncbi:MAG: ATP-binding cassette domain-containing protein [Acidobacteria bacterium]|nr:ATP-binding cassette domain-containing protein [Acidobacteriota bacterium]